MLPNQILNHILEAKAYYSELNEGLISDLKKGCENCAHKDMKCLMWVLIALNSKVSIGVLDDETYDLYLKMMKIIGGDAYTPVSDLVVYYGSKTTNDAVTLEEILESPFVPYNALEDVILDFASNPVDYEFPFIALSDSVPIPNKIENLSNGVIEDIGESGQLFGVPYQVGDFNVMQGSYVAYLANQFKIYNT